MACFWSDAAQETAPAAITLSQLMSMSSGLQYNEGYGDVSDVTRMLYLEPDMAAHAASQPLVQAPGSTFNYSSGTTVLLSRIWQRAAAGPSHEATSAAVLSLPRERLFSPLGMSSAVMEADARGNLSGAGDMYASTQDWARFSQFLLQDGVWQGKRILPEGFVEGLAPHRADKWAGAAVAPGPATRRIGQGTCSSSYCRCVLGRPMDSPSPSCRRRSCALVRLGLTPQGLGYAAAGDAGGDDQGG
jgi:CubicO group peptidase (beta-lactamase class C family)